MKLLFQLYILCNLNRDQAFLVKSGHSNIRGALNIKSSPEFKDRVGKENVKDLINNMFILKNMYLVVPGRSTWHLLSQPVGSSVAACDFLWDLVL